MIRALALLLPALIPSWRFFRRVGASPRIEFAVLASPHETPLRWREFYPLPGRLPLFALIARLFWNPRWNEHLYLVTCSERFLHARVEGRASEILRRIEVQLRRAVGPTDPPRYFQMRLMLVARDEAGVTRQEVYRSAVQPVDETQLP
jgi:hypothetical protein